MLGKVFCVTLLFLFFLAPLPFLAEAADFEFRGSIEPQTPVEHLLAFYLEKFSPETLKLTIAEQPDETGRFRDIFMDLSGVNIDEIRLDTLTFRMHDVQFNAPENWAQGNVECLEALQTYALCHITEEDINRGLAEKTFGRGRGDHWKKIALEIHPEGLKGRGVYLAKVLFVTLDILIEVDSELEIIKNRELWLKDPEVRINRLDLPDYITWKALKQIQPLLDLNRVPFPLNLHSIELQKGAATLSTRLLPKPIPDGISYSYKAE
ncbi:MAG: DUF2993 domain-containing protein [Fretibacterium sp.]|nr:DUF2993 domain-containing protein [Fretibacterium sp.]